MYESRKTQKPIQNFIPRELDDFGPDSLDMTTSEKNRKRDGGNHGFDGINGAVLNNEVPRRTDDDRAVHGQSVLRNNDGSAINNNQPPKKRDDRGLRGQSMLRNNDLGNRKPSKDIPRVKNRTTDQPAKRPSELRDEITGTSYKGPTVKPIEDGMAQKKINTGARSKPGRVPQSSDSNRSTVSIYNPRGTSRSNLVAFGEECMWGKGKTERRCPLGGPTVYTVCYILVLLQIHKIVPCVTLLPATNDM